jgi:molybdopterin/thiamine biosynthesis adenylyltransferase
VKFSKEALDEAARAHLKGTPPAAYGVWVYYPWNFRLVHLLDEAEFALVRTDRNRNKITREEQAVLATKKVGVIGLSVGQSVSLTMALERSFGEIRLADFDTLDLSNLNRLLGGVYQLGVPKVVNTARAIAELDPYLQVTLYPEGVTRENIDRFLTEGGRLDLLIEECDSVDIKIIARQRAKAHRIPVVMDTSDRGLIDVERFDLEPERALLHGRTQAWEGADFSRPLSADLRMGISQAIVDTDRLSPRLKSSLPLIGKELLTWPQLGSHVVAGGGIAAEAVRCILLGDPMPSGRWYHEPSWMVAS